MICELSGIICAFRRDRDRMTKYLPKSGYRRRLSYMVQSRNVATPASLMLSFCGCARLQIGKNNLPDIFNHLCAGWVPETFSAAHHSLA